MAITNKGFVTGIVVGAIVVTLGGVLFPVIDYVIHYEVVKVREKNPTFNLINSNDLNGSQLVKMKKSIPDMFLP